MPYNLKFYTGDVLALPVTKQWKACWEENDQPLAAITFRKTEIFDIFCYYYKIQNLDLYTVQCTYLYVYSALGPSKKGPLKFFLCFTICVHLRVYLPIYVSPEGLQSLCAYLASCVLKVTNMYRTIINLWKFSA